MEAMIGGQVDMGAICRIVDEAMKECYTAAMDNAREEKQGTAMQGAHWYDVFAADNSKGKGSRKPHKGAKSKGEHHVRGNKTAAVPSASHKSAHSADKAAKDGAQGARHRSAHKSAQVISVRAMFDDALDDAAMDVLDDFESIVQDVFPATHRQVQSTRRGIRDLSHRLTDERGERRRGYMNDAATLSPYARYFVWWNLVRLTRLFASLESKLPLEDGDVCLDVGSGPLTAVIALYLACPALRTKRLTWVCTDISQSALNLGEDLFMAVASMVMPSATDGAASAGDECEEATHWQIVKSTMRAGESVNERVASGLKEGAAFVTCVNLLNEVQESEHLTAEETVEKYSAALSRYTASGGTLLVVEPGVPPQAHVLSLMRDAFIAGGWQVASPCPHTGDCPMDGGGAYTGGKAKWCNFAFDTRDAPQRLLELSTESGLTKRRAVMSYLLLHKEDGTSPKAQSNEDGGILRLRIASDPIYLPGYRTGYYACSRLGLALVIDTSGRRYASGDEVAVRLLVDANTLERDAKTGAAMMYI